MVGKERGEWRERESRGYLVGGRRRGGGKIGMVEGVICCWEGLRSLFRVSEGLES